MQDARNTKLAVAAPIALAVVVALVALLAPRPGGGGPERAAASAALPEFDSCDALGRYVRRHAEGSAYGVDMPEGGVMPAVAAQGVVSGEATATTAPAVGGERLANPDELTNVQEAGVDEPDLVKSDGARVFAIARDELHVLVMDGDELVLTGTVELPGGTALGAERELLLSGDRVLVLGGTGGYAPDSIETLLVEVDVTDLEAPTVVRSMRVDGGYVSSRLNGTTARVVTSSTPLYPQPVFEGAPAAPGEVDVSGEELVPTLEVRDHVTGATSERPLVDCEDVRHPRRFSGTGMLSVLTIDLEQGLEPVDSDTVMTSGQTIYASTDSLYVATERWPSPGAQRRAAIGTAPPPESQTFTEIHRFEIGEPDATEYAGSGRVPGFMLSQWSMSEHEGVLRVASTTSPVWLADQAGRSESFVTVLEQGGDELERIGQTERLGVSERIYAVRFIGELGFVVTFREIDPLFTLDLSDPEDPHAVGELKVPGYSAYLHPVGEDLLMGIGQDANRSGALLGSQVSLFDISDLAAPVQVDRLSLGYGSSSEVEQDHHAFTFDESRGLAVVPQTGRIRDSLPRFRGATGMSVDDGTLRLVGNAEHPGGQSAPQIRRSIALDDSLLTYSKHGVALHDPATLARESWAPFDG